MFRTNLLKVLIPLVLLSIFGFYSYTYFLKDIYLNHQTQTIKFDSKTGFDVLELKKLNDQNNIHSLEINLKGKSNKPISFFLGSAPSKMDQHVRIKGGEIDFQYVNDWYEDVCFLKFEIEDNDFVELTIDYQFVGSGN